MCKYNPKYHMIDQRLTQDVNFDDRDVRLELFEDPQLKREENAKYELCTRLTNKLNQSLRTLEAGGAADRSKTSKKRGVKFRASTIV
jgi:hypothetical protein